MSYCRQIFPETEIAVIWDFCVFNERIIQDFPLRGRAVFLHVRKRKWQERETGHIVTNSYDLTHQGTHLTYEFASFLKEAHRNY